MPCFLQTFPFPVSVLHGRNVPYSQWLPLLQKTYGENIVRENGSALFLKGHTCFSPTSVMWWSIPSDLLVFLCRLHRLNLSVQTQKYLNKNVLLLLLPIFLFAFKKMHDNGTHLKIILVTTERVTAKFGKEFSFEKITS